MSFLRHIRIVAIAAVCGLASVATAQELRVALAAEPTSMDPHYHNQTSNNSLASEIFDALTLQDANQKLLPGLAVSWRLVDPLTWEFKLRQNVKFHDGSPFGADDVIVSMKRAPSVPGSPSSFGVFVKGKTFEKVDDLTVRVTTAQPYPFTAVDLSRIAIVSRNSAAATTDDFNAGRAAIGTGRFKLVRWRSGDSIELVRNDSYWGGAPDIERIRIRPIKTGTTRAAALLAGDVDFIEGVAPSDVARVEADRNLTVFKAVSNRLVYLSIELARETNPFIKGNDGKDIRNPFIDKRVRQAVSLAIDRAAIASRVMENLAEPSGQFSPKGYIGYSADLTADKADLDRARALMKDAGFADGFRLTIHGPNDRYTNDSRVLETIAQLLSRINIKTSVEAMPSATFFRRAESGGPNGTPEFAFYLSGYANGSGEPSHPLRVFIHTRDQARGLGVGNRNGYSNAEVDALIDRGLTTMDETQLEGIFVKATELAMRDYALLPLYHEVATWAGRKGISYATGAVDSTFMSAIKRAP